MSFIVKIILLKMQVRKDVNFFNSVIVFNFFCFDAWILISNKESDENNVWFGYDIQNTSGFHQVFPGYQKSCTWRIYPCLIGFWTTWIINEFEKRWDGMSCDEMRCDETSWDKMRRDEMRWDEMWWKMGWVRMGWDEMRWDEMIWDKIW